MCTLVFLCSLCHVDVVLWLPCVCCVHVCSLCVLSRYRKDKIENPSRVKQIARAIPQQPSYMQPLAMYAVGGVLPFAAVFIELFFIMSSIWEEQTYYVFGFLLLSLVLLVLTCAEISVVMVYFLLCCEDHRWWWRAYLTSGASAVYIFVYSAIYFFTNVRRISVCARAHVCVYVCVMRRSRVCCFVVPLVHARSHVFPRPWRCPSLHS